MMEMEEIFFSSTFGGELLSLAAAKVVLELHKKDEISPQLFSIGETLGARLRERIEFFEMEKHIKITGHPTWQFLSWTGNQNVTDLELKTYFMQEIFARGCLVLGTLNVTTSLGQKEINHIIAAFSSVLELMKFNIENGSIKALLRCNPLEPLFKVR
jgi:4-aminobutyrate aminotransferase-like enzyme